jgi:hypothetical protein
MQDAAQCRAQAEKCRSLARGLTDQDLIATLLAMAEDYEAEAGRLDAGPTPEQPNPVAE